MEVSAGLYRSPSREIVDLSKQMEEVKIAKEKSDSILQSMREASSWRKQVRADQDGLRDAASITNEIDSPGVHFPFNVNNDVEDEIARKRQCRGQAPHTADPLDFPVAR